MFRRLIPSVRIPHLHLRVPTFFQKSHQVGARPGTLNIPVDSPKPTYRIIQYNKENVDDRFVDDVQAVLDLRTETGVTWIDIQGLGDEPALRAIAKRFGIHKLALEDMVNVPQLPKIEPYDDGVVWVSRMVRFDEDGALDREQLGIYSSSNLLITFQERTGDVLDPVRKRIHEGKGEIRRSGSDYLAFALIDTVVDGYYPVAERVSRTVEELDERIMSDASPALLATVNETKVLLTMLRRILRAQYDAVAQLVADPGVHVTKNVVLYLRDVKDHAAQLSEVVDNLKELSMGLLNTYLSMVSYRTNEVMKVLTIMASIFIPLTFVAGIYGMNFEHMPELSQKWAYPAALGVMLAVGLGMLYYFFRKGWIGTNSQRARNSGYRQ